MEDRIRAKEPVNDKASWSEGTITGYERKGNKYSVTVNRTDDGCEQTLSISSSIFDLFESRVDSDDLDGCVCWFKKKKGSR